MPVQAINTAVPVNHKKRKFNPVTVTGYTAVAAGLGSGIAGSNKKIKLHKQLAYAAGIFTAVHIGLIEWFHHKPAKK